VCLVVRVLLWPHNGGHAERRVTPNVKLVHELTSQIEVCRKPFLHGVLHALYI
jgi:hypothetical protein